MLLDGEEPENQRDTCQRREKNPGIAAERMIALPASMRENRHSRLRSSAVRTLNYAPVVGVATGDSFMPFYNNGIRTDDARVEPFSSLQAKVDKADGRLLPRAGDWQESVRDGLRSLPATAR